MLNYRTHFTEVGFLFSKRITRQNTPPLPVIERFSRCKNATYVVLLSVQPGCKLQAKIGNRYSFIVRITPRRNTIL
jgi:hypothetical protein